MSDTFRLDRRALTPESYKALKKLVDDDKVLVPVEPNYVAAHAMLIELYGKDAVNVTGRDEIWILSAALGEPA